MKRRYSEWIQISDFSFIFAWCLPDSSLFRFLYYYNNIKIIYNINNIFLLIQSPPYALFKLKTEITESGDTLGSLTFVVLGLDEAYRAAGLVVWAISLEFGQSGADGIELRARTLVDVVLVCEDFIHFRFNESYFLFN